jgi:hypothetical protein
LEEVREDESTQIWIRGEPHSVKEFLLRVYGAAKVEEEGEGEAAETVENGEKGGKGEKGGESI